MTVSTSLVEFEESYGIKTFFELEQEHSKPSFLYIVLEDRLLASLEIVRGTLFENIDLILEESIQNEVDSFSGFLSKLNEEFPDDIMVKFTYEQNEINQYHMFKFGDLALTCHLVVLGQWYEEDLDKFRIFLDSIIMHEDSFTHVPIGDILSHDNFLESIGNRVGVRSYLGNSPILMA